MTDTLRTDATIASTDRPAIKPARPFFSSGPCAKPPGWDAGTLPHASLGRSHRSKLGKSRLAHAIDLTRKILQVPRHPSHRHRPRFGYRRGRNGDVDAARAAPRHHRRLGKLR